MRLIFLLAGLAGPILAALVPPPAGLEPEAWRTAGIAAMMAVWWMTGALPLAVTALVPLVLAPLTGLGPLRNIAEAYVHPLLFLFLGGFLLGSAIERCGLHRRLALAILGLAGARPDHLLGAVMLATAFLSLWISNTASAIVMAPIAASLVAGRAAGDRFATALMLGVAYGATIGGMGSLIGTPPNALFAAYVSQTHGVVVGFAQWALVGLPVAGLLLGLAWLVLSRVTPGLGRGAPPGRDIARPGVWTTAERRVASIATLTVAAWIARPLMDRLVPDLGLGDAGIAMIAGALLFLWPSGAGGGLLKIGALKTLRWDILILFGGGLALAGMIDRSGLADWIGGQMTRIEGWPVWLVILVIAGVIVSAGELASNTAMAAVFMPIGGAVALAMGVDPLSFLVPVALAASVGFMLPVATPPNALVMANPAVTPGAMLKAGALLDVAGLLVVIVLGRFLAEVLL